MESNVWNTYISCEKRVATKGAAFAIVVGVENDQNVLECDDDGERPDNNGENLDKIVIVGG